MEPQTPAATRVPTPEDAPETVRARTRLSRVPCPSLSPTRGPTWGACRKPRARLPADPGGDVAAVRCPPPAGPPVGLSCRSVLPESWSRLSPSALSAHSYLERPEPADAAAAMAPPRGRAGTVYGWAATSGAHLGWRLADAELSWRSCRFARFQMCPPGDPDIGPGSPINLGRLC